MSDYRSDLYRSYVSAFKGQSEHDVSAYLQWCRHKYLPLVSRLNRDAPVLELGCGPGYMLTFLQVHGFSNTVGIDISDEQVQIAVARGTNAQVADAIQFLDTKSETFQAVFAIDFVEHFTRGELLALFSLVHKALCPSGLFIVQTPNGEGLFAHQVVYADLTHLTILSPSSLQHLLTFSGFTDISFQETGPVPKNAVGGLRTVLWRMIVWGANAVRMIETGKKQSIWTENMICCARKA